MPPKNISEDRIDFKIKNTDDTFSVFTTRPDTLFGATYCVFAPEHPLVDKITSKDQLNQINAYKEACANKSDLDRMELSKDKTGVFTGAYAINPVNNQPIPIWIADYVLMSYGTGSIMAVPGHDQRDWEFAKNSIWILFQLSKIKQLKMKPGQEMAFLQIAVL